MVGKGGGMKFGDKAEDFADASMPSKTRRSILSIFKQLYPEPASELNFSNEYELLISVTLSAQTTDKKVNEVTEVLFKKYPDFKSLAKAKVSDVEKIIRFVNYYITKSKNIIETSKIIVEKFEGKVPKQHDVLITLPGVGRKTANVVLSELGASPAIAVDTHVFRVSKRIGLSNGAKPRDVEEDLMRSFDPKDWRSLHHWLILHGRRVCDARNPKCEECGIFKYCEKNMERRAPARLGHVLK